MKRRHRLAADIARALLPISIAGAAIGTAAYWLPATILGWTP